MVATEKKKQILSKNVIQMPDAPNYGVNLCTRPINVQFNDEKRYAIKCKLYCHFTTTRLNYTESELLIYNNNNMKTINITLKFVYFLD